MTNPGVMHLKKLCVGVASLQELIDWRHEHRTITGLATMSHTTRMWPKQEEAILNGGSLYWIVAGEMVCRQQIVGLERVFKDERPACRILLDADIVPTEPRPHRPFQGWRYLKPEEAPADMLSPSQGAEIPAALREELRDLGLL